MKRLINITKNTFVVIFIAVFIFGSCLASYLVADLKWQWRLFKNDLGFLDLNSFSVRIKTFEEAYKEIEIKNKAALWDEMREFKKEEEKPKEIKPHGMKVAPEI